MYIFINRVDFFRRLFNHKQKKHTKNTHSQAVIQYDKQRLGVIHNFTLSGFDKHPGYRRDPRVKRVNSGSTVHNNLCIYVFIYIYIHMNLDIHNTETPCLGFNLMLAWCWTCFCWVHGAEYHFGFMSLARWQIFSGRLVAWQSFLWWQGFVWRCFFWYNQLWILVGGFNPFEKYAPQNGNPSPRKGENKKNIWNHHLDQLWIAFGACFNCENIHPRNLQQDLLNGPLNLSI